jgi:hypothetical protein
MEVYIVKSFSPENGWVNLKAFDNNDAAVSFANTVEKQIPKDVFFENEFVEIEVLNVRSW